MLSNKEYNSVATIYENLHRVSVSSFSSSSSSELHTREIQIRILKNTKTNEVIIKIRELDNFSFYFICKFDYLAFNRLKDEQSLEITFEELSAQLIDLLRETEHQKIFLRLDVNTTSCKMIFYEKSKLKSLIFLTVDLEAISKTEIIDEMAENIHKLNDSNKHLKNHVITLNTTLEDEKHHLEEALNTNKDLCKEFGKFFTSIETLLKNSTESFENAVNSKLRHLNLRIHTLFKKCTLLRQTCRDTSEKLHLCEQKLICARSEKETLQIDVHRMKIAKQQLEDQCTHLRESCRANEIEREGLLKQIRELQVDNQEATLIIAKKTKTHDEIAKDLVQANTMLVNFNNQYHTLANELEEKKEQLSNKERRITEQELQIKQLEDDFDLYRKNYGADQLNSVQDELANSKRSVRELEKQNTEVTRLNALLTRKLSAMDPTTPVLMTTRNSTLLPPSQRTNY